MLSSQLFSTPLALSDTDRSASLCLRSRFRHQPVAHSSARR